MANEELHFRNPESKILKIITQILYILIVTLGLLYLTQLLNLFGFYFHRQIFLPLFLGSILVLVFIKNPLSKSDNRNYVPWYDWIFIIVAIFGTIYPAIKYKEIYLYAGRSVTQMELLLGLLFIIALFEAVRRTVGSIMLFVLLFFIVHARLAPYFPYALKGPESNFYQIIRYIYLSDQGIFSSILYIGGTIILIFVLFGSCLDVGGGSKQFMDLSLSIVGKARGGIAKVAVVSSALFGTLTGSPVANVGITGSFTIPLMKRSGYQPNFAAAVEAVASTGGVILPPVMGAVAFVMAEVTGLGYAAICRAAILPAILFYMALFLQIHWRALKYGIGTGLERKDIPSFGTSIKNAWSTLVVFAFLIYLLIVLRITPEYAAFLSTCFLLILIIIFRYTKGYSFNFIEVVNKTAETLINVIPVIAASGIIIGSISLTGLGISISDLILSFSGESIYIIVLLSGLTIYILGFGISAIASYIILATLVAPAMVEGGIPLIAAHFFLLYVGTSMFITPPYAVAAYTAATIANANPINVGLQAMKLGIVSYIAPIAFIFSPALLMEGSIENIILSFVTASIGILLITISIEGFIITEVSPFIRLIFLMSGITLFIPDYLCQLIAFTVSIPILIMLYMKKNQVLTV